MRCVLREAADVLLHRSAGERTRDPEGPWECSPAKREVETRGCGMQMRPTAREPPRGIGDDREAGPGVHSDNSQQLMPGGLLTTPQARADGPLTAWGHATLHFLGGRDG